MTEHSHPAPDLVAQRHELRERLAAMQDAGGESWEALRADLTDLAKAAASNDAQRVAVLMKQVELSRTVNQGIAEGCKELRQQIDSVLAEELGRASLRASEHVARATWVLAGATIVLAIATVALIFVTWKA